MEFFPQVELSRNAAEAIARGLYAVAKSDGLHEKEAGLIASFWLDTGGSSADLSDLERGATAKPEEIAAALHTAEEKDLFLKTAILLAYADGQVTAAERQTLGQFGSALGIDATKLGQLEAGVKDFLLGHLTHLQNTDALQSVVKKLGV